MNFSFVIVFCHHHRIVLNAHTHTHHEHILLFKPGGKGKIMAPEETNISDLLTSIHFPLNMNNNIKKNITECFNANNENVYVLYTIERNDRKNV